jgi:hypothetical protein
VSSVGGFYMSVDTNELCSRTGQLSTSGLIHSNRVRPIIKKRLGTPDPTLAPSVDYVVTERVSLYGRESPRLRVRRDGQRVRPSTPCGNHRTDRWQLRRVKVIVPYLGLPQFCEASASKLVPALEINLPRGVNRVTPAILLVVHLRPDSPQGDRISEWSRPHDGVALMPCRSSEE